jgi:hypothetical protein
MRFIPALNESMYSLHLIPARDEFSHSRNNLLYGPERNEFKCSMYSRSASPSREMNIHAHTMKL